jgi:hypothetical protein
MIDAMGFGMMEIFTFDGGGLRNDSKSSNGKVVNSMHMQWFGAIGS